MYMMYMYLCKTPNHWELHVLQFQNKQIQQNHMPPVKIEFGTESRDAGCCKLNLRNPIRWCRHESLPYPYKGFNRCTD